MADWQEHVSRFFAEQTGNLWVWFDGLNREEWLVVLGSCCLAGFLLLKSWGRRGPC